jgi:hypothetical protein
MPARYAKSPPAVKAAEMFVMCTTEASSWRREGEQGNNNGYGSRTNLDFLMSEYVVKLENFVTPNIQRPPW